jgi:hypothetical protein
MESRTVLHARRVLSADRRGSSLPVLVETDDGVRFTKLRGAAQGTGALVAEMIVASLAEALGLSTPARALVQIEHGIESVDRNGELRHLLDASAGINLGFAYLDGAHVLKPEDVERVNRDDAAAIVWLDRFVMNPDRADRNTNLLWWHNALWLIDHGAALGFQYEWSAVSEATPARSVSWFEPHVLRDRVTDLLEWDEILAARLTRDVIEDAVAQVPDDFFSETGEALRRRRAAFAAFLWKRLRSPREWVVAVPVPRPRAPVPAWLAASNRRRTDT